jgi:hypothetical protein
MPVAIMKPDQITPSHECRGWRVKTAVVMRGMALSGEATSGTVCRREVMLPQRVVFDRQPCD